MPQSRTRSVMFGRGALCAAAVLAAGIAGFLWMRYGSANLYRIESNDMAMHVDFETFHKSAVALLHGQDIYATGAPVPNLDPPFWTVVLAPFGLISPLPAYRLFSMITMTVLLGGYALVARELRLPAAPAGLVMCAMFASSPLLSTVALGQVYGVLLAGLVGAWLADRRGYSRLAGVLLGLVVALKPTLAPILLWPILRRNKSMLLAGVGGAVGGTVIGVLVPGPNQTAHWLRLMTQTTISTSGDNASLPALLLRLGGPAWIGFTLGAVAIAIVSWRIWRSTTDQVAVGLWALAAATLLMSPVAWHNYLVLCFPGVLTLLAQRRFALVALLAALPTIGVEWAWLWPGNGMASRLGLSLYCLILATYWLALTSYLPRRAPSRVERLSTADMRLPANESVTELVEQQA